MSNNPFGPLVGPWQVEQAVLTTLKEWVPSALAELERKNSLTGKIIGRPPGPAAYRGGLDWLSVKEEWLPCIIVVAKPQGEPERNAESIFQTFRVRVGCVVKSEEGADLEAEARMRASYFATATLLLGPNGSLGGLAEETILVGSPDVEFLDDELRKVAVGVTEWNVYAEIMQPAKWPPTVKEVEPEGAYTEWPEAKTNITTVKGEPVETPL